MSGIVTAQSRAVANVPVAELEAATAGDRRRWCEQFGGQYRLETGEVNGWGSVGFSDDSNTQDLGNHDDANLTWISGGFIYPFAVQLRRVFAGHRVNNDDAEPFGFVVFGMTKTVGGTVRATTFYRHETQENGNVGPRDYGESNQYEEYDDDLTGVVAAQNIPAFTYIGFGVSMPEAATAAAIRLVQVGGGFMEFERLL